MKKMVLILSVVSFCVIAASAQLAENTQRAIKAFENGKWEEGFRLSKDADLNDKSIQFYLGVMYVNGFGVAKDESEAVKWYSKAAEQGEAAAQFNLGVMYEYGRGVPKDESEAVKWYRKAAEQGVAMALHNLGVMYENGRGVTKDESEAVKWYRKAAAQGDARAQYNLGVMYANGRGVTKDESEAVKWYRKAAEQEIAQAQYNLGVMYMDGRGVMKDDYEAVKWFRKAAEQGLAQAQYNLGVMYDNGEGVAQDDYEAVKWYRKAAEQGFAPAQYNLGVAYANGRGVTKDDSEAVKWYRKAAEQGNADAQYNLGVMYEYGRGVIKDESEAVKWYRKATEQGFGEAQCNLGVMYENGRDVTDKGIADRLRKMLEDVGTDVKEIIEQRPSDQRSGGQKANEQEAEEQKSRGIRWWFVLGCNGIIVGLFFWIVRRKNKREGASVKTDRVNEDIGDEISEEVIESFDAQISTDVPFVTWLLTALIVACSGYVFLRTNSLMHVPADALLKFGGDLKSLTFSGEEWRLWSSTFLHGGLIHLAMNMACLLSFGPLLERMTGHIKFLSLYLISAIGSGIISMKFNGDVVSIGASGAIFGIFGSLMMYVLVMGKRFGLTYDSILAYMKEGLIFIGVNLVYSLRPGIDMSAHLGGLLVGAGTGLFIAAVDCVRIKELSRIFTCCLAVFSAIVIAKMTYSWLASDSWISSDFEDYSTEFKFTLSAAEQGDAAAQFNLGAMYDEGEGVKQDEYEAVKWYRKAAEQGYAMAQYNLGVAYMEGRGVPKDDSEAVKWYRKAAEQGLGDAQCNLGLMHEYGRGVKQDDSEAVKWFRKAAEQGDVDAQFYLGVMYANGEGVRQDDYEAVKWFRKAAKQGDEDAKEALEQLGY